MLMDGQQESSNPTAETKTTPSSEPAVNMQKVIKLFVELVELEKRPDKWWNSDQEEINRTVSEQIHSQLALELPGWDYELRVKIETFSKKKVTGRITLARKRMLIEKIDEIKAKIANAVEGDASAIGELNQQGAENVTAARSQLFKTVEELDQERGELAKKLGELESEKIEKESEKLSGISLDISSMYL